MMYREASINTSKQDIQGVQKKGVQVLACADKQSHGHAAWQ